MTLTFLSIYHDVFSHTSGGTSRQHFAQSFSSGDPVFTGGDGYRYDIYKKGVLFTSVL